MLFCFQSLQITKCFKNVSSLAPSHHFFFASLLQKGVEYVTSRNKRKNCPSFKLKLNLINKIIENAIEFWLTVNIYLHEKLFILLYS